MSSTGNYKIDIEALERNFDEARQLEALTYPPDIFTPVVITFEHNDPALREALMRYDASHAITLDGVGRLTECSSIAQRGDVSVVSGTLDSKEIITALIDPNDNPTT